MTEIRNGPDTYGAFLNDVRGKEPKILPDDEVSARIMKLRNPLVDVGEKAVIKDEVIGSVLKLIPFAIEKSRSPASGKPEELVGEAFEIVNSCIKNFDSDHVSPVSEEKAKFQRM